MTFATKSAISRLMRCDTKQDNTRIIFKRLWESITT